MSALLSLPSALPAGLARFGVLRGTSALLPDRQVRTIDWPELEEILPDHGFPIGVVELACPFTKRGALRSGATTIALSMARSIHARDANAWCAWITPSSVAPLYAPAVAQADVDLDRLLVARPAHSALARTVVKVAASGAFELVVVDAHRGLGEYEGRRRLSINADLVVRKLSLAAEDTGTTTFLLTDLYAPRAVPWPVALRLEVERRPEALAVRVTKDRRGRADENGLRASPHVVRLAS